MRILTSTLSSEMEILYDEFERTFGFGPCGAYSVYQRQLGNGEVAICTATAADPYGTGGMEFPHYVNVSDGDIIDFTNPFDEELTYSDVEILEHDEMPELVDATVMAWLQERV